MRPFYRQLKPRTISGGREDQGGGGTRKVEPAIAEGIPHARDIIGFRNILAYGYAELDHDKVYGIAVKHAPELLSAVQKVLKNFPEPPRS